MPPVFLPPENSIPSPMDLFKLPKKLEKHIRDPHDHFQITLGLAAVAFFLVTLTFFPGGKFGILSFLKNLQGIFAANAPVSVEIENATVAAPAFVGGDSTASGGKYVQFGTGGITGQSYFVDCNGDDAKDGKSEANAWKTLNKASGAVLNGGEGLLFKRGCSWDGTLTVSRSGVEGSNIVVGAWGTGNLPIIQTSGAQAVNMTGNYVTVANIHAKALVGSTAECPAASGVQVPIGATDGIAISGDYNTVTNSEVTGAWAGIEIKLSASNTKVINNNIHDNTMMKFDGGDSGAFGVLIHGTDNEIAYNTLGNHDACSQDYVRDGADVEIYQGQRNSIHHNRGSNSDAFTELGGDSTKAGDNTFAHNRFTSNLPRSIFMVTRGSSDGFGPVNNTKMYNNVAYLTGATSQGVVCYAGCNSSIVVMRNNIMQANKAIYADGNFDENYNMYVGQVAIAGGSAVGPNSKKPLTVGFVNAPTGDLHLQVSSGAVNAGTTGSGFNKDLDGFAVPAPGTAVDMGAYEFGSVLGVSTGDGSVLQASSSVNIAAVGDMNPTSNTSTTSSSGKNGAAIAAGLANGSLDAFLGLGDFQYDVPNCSNYVNQWKTLWGGTKSKLYWITGPNHDVEPGRNEDLDNFMNGECAGDTTKSAINAARGFIGNMDPYSFDLGNWHFAMLSTALWRYDTTKANQTTAWLDSDLAAAKAAGKHLAVAYHDPYFTSDTSSHSRETAVKPWIDIMDKHDVRFTLSGSQHNFERSCPVTKSDACVADNDPNGMSAFQVSTGGIGLRSFTSSPGYIVKRFSDTHGWLKLTLNSDGSFSWTFNPVSGAGTDSGSRPAAGGTAASAPVGSATPPVSPVPSPPPPPPCLNPTAEKGMVTANINVANSGSFIAWSRMSAPDSTNNSYYLKVDEGCAINVADNGLSPNTWTWVDYKDANTSNKIALSLSAGSHSIKLIGREGGVKLDRLILTEDAACVPVGNGDNCVNLPIASPSPSPTPPPPLPLPTLPPSSPDTDGDGFSDSVEGYLGTDPLKACADIAGDGASPTWPADLVMKESGLSSFNKINLPDLQSYTNPVRRLDAVAGGPNFEKRWDINADGRVTVADLQLLSTFTPPIFDGARAFNGPKCKELAGSANSPQRQKQPEPSPTPVATSSALPNERNFRLFALFEGLDSFFGI